MTENYMDRELYRLPMTSLQCYFDGKPVLSDAIDAFQHEGQLYRRDDIVVVDGVLANLECVNHDRGVCGLGISFDLDGALDGGEYTSGHRCSLEGLRHATSEENALYERLADIVCCRCNAADMEREERMIKGR